ncbi:LUD domain-containing protein [Actinocorallia populi]|uniref:LUD domain-containing protein n=1 Tax=Actinocorallia populi TaxID=2079200 RepID=UPI000D09764A|nr:LUD domain-containing protein [Actinocorallia populi]
MVTPLPLPVRFADAARTTLAVPGSEEADSRRRRAEAVAELPDWEELRHAGEELRDRTLRHLDTLLETLEAAVVRAGGTVHWARDAAEARRIVTRLASAAGGGGAVELPSPLTRRIDAAGALAAAGITLHRAGGPARERLLDAALAVSGARFLVAETGTVVAFEPDGDARMCLTLPRTLITVAGIEQVVPRLRDLEVLLQLLPRSAGERMSPYVTMWTGVTPDDGPREFHLVLLDDGRTAALSDGTGRTALRCVGCEACLRVCPVYKRVGDDPYGELPGPIGAILTPQLRGIEAAHEASLPFASTLCGACADVCPVRIDIPDVLVHLRARVVESRRRHPVPTPELALMRAAAWTMGDRWRYERALARATRWGGLLPGGLLRRLPVLPLLLGRWTDARDLPALPDRSFRDWWKARR